MAEWSKAVDCKSVGSTYVGSNPTFSKKLKVIMGFLTIWISLIVILIFTNIIFTDILKIKVNSIFSSFVICTFICFIIYSFICFFYYDFFLYFLIVKTSTPFFISDPNLLAYHLFQNRFFFAWLTFIPIVIFNISFIIKSILIKDEHFVVKRYVYIILYVHAISFFISHFDLFSIYQAYFASTYAYMFEGIDFSSYNNLYWGTYTDIFYVVISIHLITYTFLENFHKISIIFYFFELSLVNIISRKKSYWITFVISLLIRTICNLITFYFFIGEGFISDFVVIIFANISIEFLLFFFRFFTVRSTWNRLSNRCVKNFHFFLCYRIKYFIMINLYYEKLKLPILLWFIYIINHIYEMFDVI